jgi:methyltransferase (TIGR00027 family)
VKVGRRQVSTARGVALVRAIEMTRPEGARVSSDPYAHRFVNPLSVQGMRLVGALGINRLTGIEGLMNFALAREQYIEDLMARELRAGIEQIVVLGAGFDTRAYRLPEAAAVPVFEVDHPVTQAAKREALRGVVDPLPADVHFVGVDFDHDDLGQRLRAARYRETARTLFVWQGVIVYLTREGADRTLAFIANHSAPGSLVVFDSMDSSALASAGATGLKLFTTAMGENVTFGIARDEIVPYLESRGFTDVEVLDYDAMRRTYLGSRPIAPGVYVASGRVRSQGPHGREP